MTICFKVTDAYRRSFPGLAIQYTYGRSQVVESDILGIFLFRRRKDAENYIARYQTRSGEVIEHYRVIGIGPPVFPLEIHRVKAIGRGRRMPYCPVIIRGLHGVVMESVIEFKDTLLGYMRSAPYVEADKAGGYATFMASEVLGCAPGTVVYPGVEVLD